MVSWWIVAFLRSENAFHHKNCPKSGWEIVEVHLLGNFEKEKKVVD